MATPQPDPRLEQLVELVVQLASGELSVRLPPSPAADDIDAVIVGINMLAEELEALNKHLEGRVAERTRQLADAHRQLERLALYDPLTDLANRTLLAERIDEAVANTGLGGHMPAVLVLDLDGFKAVNDSFGHAVGDELLMEVARRLRAVCRGTDTVARLGGDEFALVVVDASEGQVLDVADRIMAALQVPVRAGRQTCWISASIGVRFAERGQTAGVLLRDADTAMYVAKSHGRGGASVYEPAMHVAALRRLRQADELRAALSGNEFATYYQPIIELATGRATSVEALLRWRHPTDGLRTADTFIPVAEETGLIVALDGWVLDSAVAQVAAWRALAAGPGAAERARQRLADHRSAPPASPTPSSACLETARRARRRRDAGDHRDPDDGRGPADPAGDGGAAHGGRRRRDRRLRHGVLVPRLRSPQVRRRHQDRPVADHRAGLRPGPTAHRRGAAGRGRRLRPHGRRRRRADRGRGGGAASSSAAATGRATSGARPGPRRR